MQIRQEKGCYTLYKENEAIGTAVVDGTTILRLEVVPRWRGRGYGSYLLKELLRQNGGLDPKQATRFTAPLPRDAAGRALAQKYGFAPDGSQLVRRRVPDLSAVQLCHAFLTARLAPGGLYVDATCGNGHDTQFLCTLAGPAGRVLGLDIQQQAVDNTNARLAAAGYGAVGRAVLHDHARLAELVQPGTADCVLFNFGWLPGAEHDVHSTADGSVPALRAALEALRPGGVLAAVLYSGKVIGDAEKQAALAQKYGFAPDGSQLVRRRVPDLSAVQLCHAFLTARLAPGGLYVDATCGNGHDTQFLCTLAGPAGRVLGLDIQQQAVDNTNARLAAAGYGAVGRAVLHDHARLAELVQPGTADCVLFNFGWLPGAEHDVHSTADGSVPALRAALEALRPGGVLAAVLYSGKVIGDAEKQAALAFFKALPLTQYTVLVCEFANWAQTAPLPCFVIKK